MFGEHGWIYCGQVTPERNIAFLRYRTNDFATITNALDAPIMSVIAVGYPSITRALRAGNWRRLGRFPLRSELLESWPMVWWSVGTLMVTVWLNGADQFETRVEDPKIQDFEVTAVWDAEFHIPSRLTADFDPEDAEWHVGGPVWRERMVREEFAHRSPESPAHRLPPDWVWTQRSADTEE